MAGSVPGSTPLQEIREARRELERTIASAVAEFLERTGGVEITEIDIRLIAHREDEGGKRVQRQLVLGVDVQVKI